MHKQFAATELLRHLSTFIVYPQVLWQNLEVWECEFTLSSSSALCIDFIKPIGQLCS